MKAVEINKTGGPEVLEVKDISLDKPGPDQVSIEQKAIGLNYIDTYHRSGLYPLKLPIGLGLEGAGIITDVGNDVKNFKIGDMRLEKLKSIWNGNERKTIMEKLDPSIHCKSHCIRHESYQIIINSNKINKITPIREYDRFF